MARTARIEIRPADVEGADRLPLSRRPHFLRVIAANGRQVLTSEVYANKTNARRAAVDVIDAFWQIAAPEDSLAPVVREFDADGRQVRACNVTGNEVAP